MFQTTPDLCLQRSLHFPRDKPGHNLNLKEGYHRHNLNHTRQLHLPLGQDWHLSLYLQKLRLQILNHHQRTEKYCVWRPSQTGSLR